MAQPKAIDKKLFPYKSMDYYALRKEGIALIEKYSGHRWTDFNVHDPGVTILEVLCYVLTELGYKINFPIEDILYSSPDMSGFYLKENAFYTAREILPCQPVTYIDFRKLLIDRIKPVNNAWLFSDEGEEACDLMEVWLLLDDDMAETEDEVIEKAHQIMAAHRNLCQDVKKISILPREACRLEATIFIDNKIDPEKTAARILFELEKTLLNPTLKRHSVSEMLDNNIPLETIYDGPEMHHGYFSYDLPYDYPRKLDLLQVMNTILSIDGVYHINDLAVIFSGKRYTDHIDLDGCLPVFEPDFSFSKGHNVSFYKNETVLPFNEQESIQLYEQLKSQQKRNYAIDTLENTETDHEEGRYRGIVNYLSLQHEFPVTYGIGKYGIPPNSSNERKAQVKQLKAFLLHFEQLLANSFSQLANLKQLFSIYPVTQTYFHQMLTDVPGLNPLISDGSNTETDDPGIEAAAKHYLKWKHSLEDESLFLKRRNDFLNHLLARFNVAFNESIYYDFGYFPQRNTVLKRLINAKEYYLQDMVALSRDRGKGINYRGEEKSPLSFKRQLELLLDIDYNNNPKLSLGVKDIVFDLMFMVDSEEIDDDPVKEDVHSYSKEAILEDFLSAGSQKDKYYVESSAIYDAYRILLNLKNEAIAIEMGIVREKEDAVEAIGKFCSRILDISIKTEGVYVVEHLLLRSREDNFSDKKDPFYDYRISLVFPSWPVRFQRKGFREQVKIILSDIVPAHIRADCFWIDLESMKVFEELHTSWMDALGSDPFSEKTSQRALALKALLENYNDNPV